MSNPGGIASISSLYLFQVKNTPAWQKSFFKLFSRVNLRTMRFFLVFDMCWPVYQRIYEKSLMKNGAEGTSAASSSNKAADAADIARTAKLLRLLRSVRILRVIRALKWVKKLGRCFYLIARFIILLRTVHYDDYPGNSPSQAVHEADCRFIRHLRHHRMFPVWPNIANAIRKHVAHSIHASPASYA